VLAAPARDARLGGSPKLRNTISNQRFDESGVLIHGFLLMTRTLVKRLLVTRILVKHAGLVLAERSCR
jgi:hypothetical protein